MNIAVIIRMYGTLMNSLFLLSVFVRYCVMLSQHLTDINYNSYNPNVSEIDFDPHECNYIMQLRVFSIIFFTMCQHYI